MPVLKPIVPPGTAVQTVLDGLRASKPVAFWDVLVTEQQTSINNAVREFADVMDPEVWDRTVRNLKKLVRVLEKKKDFVLDSPLWRTSGIKPADVKASWGPAVKILKTIVESELVDLQTMKKFDGRMFLEGTGAVLYAETHKLFRSMKDDPLQRIENMKVTVKKSEDQAATVVLQSSDPKVKPIELEMAVSERRWFVPRLSLIVGYALKTVPSYRKLFSTYCLADWKDQYVQDMDRLEKALDQLEAAKSSDEFQTIVGREIFPVALQRVALFRKGPPKYRGLKAASYRRKVTTAMVLIKGNHSPYEPSLSALTARLKGAVPAPDSISFPMTIDGTTVILVDPVKDIGALAKTIDLGKVTQVDAKRKTVIVELPDSAPGAKTATHAKALAKPRSAAN